jgi:hypothetical protein
MAPNVNYDSAMSHLETIVTRQTKTRSRDFMFMCFVALAAIMTTTTIGTAVAASVHVVR